VAPANEDALAIIQANTRIEVLTEVLDELWKLTA
jgi:hypothetical protein